MVTQHECTSTVHSHSNWNLLNGCYVCSRCEMLFSTALLNCLSQPLSLLFALWQCLFIRKRFFRSVSLSLSLHLFFFMMLAAHLNMFPCLRAHQFAKLINNLFVAVKCVMSNCKHCLLPLPRSRFLSLPDQSERVNWYATYFASPFLQRTASTAAPATAVAFFLHWIVLIRAISDKVQIG